MVSAILTPVADEMDKGTECRSTEEMIRGIHDANERIKQKNGRDESKEIVVVSQDVDGLYPELRRAETVRIAGKLMEESEISFEDVNFQEVGKYLAIHLTQESIVKNNLVTVIPDRVKTQNGPVGGPKPGMAYLDSEVDNEGEEKWSWKGKRKTPSKAIS